MERDRIKRMLAEAEPGICLIFLDEEGLDVSCLEEMLPAPSEVILAVRTTSLAERLVDRGLVLRANLPDFTDRLKLLSEGKGFPLVLVLDRDPVAVRQALGASAVFGSVRLFVSPPEAVEADLHSTINYKSLVVEGSGFGTQD